MGLADYAPVLGVLQSIDSSPRRISMRLLGMSGDEADAQIPTWAWAVGALALGVTTGVLLAPKIKLAKNSLKSAMGSSSVANKAKKVFGRFG